jgi:hypothetical protein
LGQANRADRDYRRDLPSGGHWLAKRQTRRSRQVTHSPRRPAFRSRCFGRRAHIQRVLQGAGAGRLRSGVTKRTASADFTRRRNYVQVSCPRSAQKALRAQVSGRDPSDCLAQCRQATSASHHRNKLSYMALVPGRCARVATLLLRPGIASANCDCFGPAAHSGAGKISGRTRTGTCGSPNHLFDTHCCPGTGLRAKPVHAPRTCRRVCTRGRVPPQVLG